MEQMFSLEIECDPAERDLLIAELWERGSAGIVEAYKTGRGRILVTDPGSGALVGILSRRDLLRVRHAVTHSERARRAYFVIPRRRRAVEVSKVA